MMRIARRFVLSLLLLVLCFGAAGPPAEADPSRGRFEGCIQFCNIAREACVENFAQDCRTLHLGTAEYGTCITQFLPVCNRVAFDCKYNYCIGGGPEPLQVRSQENESPEAPRAVE